MAESKTCKNTCPAELGNINRVGAYTSTETLVHGEPKETISEDRAREKKRLGIDRAEEVHGINASAPSLMQRLLGKK